MEYFFTVDPALHNTIYGVYHSINVYLHFTSNYVISSCIYVLSCIVRLFVILAIVYLP